MERSNVMRSILFLIVILEVIWTCFAQDPLLQMLDTPTDISTQAGCNVTRTCSAANARMVIWSPTRAGALFTNTTSRNARTITDSNGTITAILTFTNITTEDQGEYSCIIIFDSGRSSISTIRVVITIPEPINITSIADYSLSNLTIGEALTVGCVIETCGSPNTVNFTSENSSVLFQISRANDGAFNWNPMVTCELPGTYRCIAENQLGQASRTFTISGTPQPSEVNREGCTPSSASGGARSLHTLSTMLLTSLLLLVPIIYN